MSDAWFISPDGRTQSGPYTLEQVREHAVVGTVTSQTLVWRAGMPSWVHAAYVSELGLAPSAPPPIPAPAPMTYAPAPSSGSGPMVGIIIGVVAVLVIFVLGAVVLAGVMLPSLGKARGAARQIKDSTQVRGVHQGMVLWAQNNNDTYPLPSLLDTQNTTLAAGDAKDLPRHITSILIYNGFISPELCISPAEVNGGLAVDVNYSYVNPPGAAGKDKSRALWDPSFKAYPHESVSYTPTGASTRGGLSYAFMPPVGGRRSHWTNNFIATQAIVGNRGPAYNASGAGAATTWVLVPAGPPGPTGNSEVGANSNTLLIHGARTTWEGNICYNDNHVNFETIPDPPASPFAFAGVSPQPLQDNLFVNENDSSRGKDGTTGLAGADAANTNNLLRGWNGGNFDPVTGALIDIPSQLWFD